MLASARKSFKNQVMDRESRMLSQCQTGITRRSTGFRVAAGLVRIWGSLSFLSTTGGCAGQGDPLYRAIAGWTGVLLRSIPRPHIRYMHTRAGEAREVSCGSPEAHRQRGWNCRWKTSPRCAFLTRCSQGDRSCTSKVQDNPCQLQRRAQDFSKQCLWKSCQGKLIPSRQQSCQG